MAVDFTKQMKHDFTILAPDIFPTHMELLQEVFALHGYHVEVLHDEGPAVIAAGLKYLHNDMCYPATCAVIQKLPVFLMLQTTNTRKTQNIATTQKSQTKSGFSLM